MATPFKMKGSPMARNFGINAESPAKQVGLVKLAVKTGKKVYKGVKKLINSKKTTKATEVKHSLLEGKTGSKGTKNYNPFNDPNKAKKTIMSDPKINPAIRTEYTNQFLKAGKLNIK